MTSRAHSFRQRGVGSEKKKELTAMSLSQLPSSDLSVFMPLPHRLLALIYIYIYTLPLQVVSVCIMARLETKTKTGRGRGYRGTSFLIADSVRFTRVCGEECFGLPVTEIGKGEGRG